MEYRTITEGHRGYKVSEDGTSIISPKTGDEITIQDNIVKGKVSGYKYATLLWDTDGETMWYATKRIPVHILVCSLWHGPRPADKPWVNHKDGNKGNNHYSNLEWMSISENIRHSFTALGRAKPKGMKGLRHKESTKMKQARAKKGAKHPKFRGYYIVYGNRYESMTAAGKAIGKNSMYIHRRIKENAEGFSFEPLNLE